MSLDTSTSSPTAPVTPHPPRKRFAGVAAGAAALMIVALLAATLAFTLHSRQATKTTKRHTVTTVATQPPAPTNVNPPSGQVGAYQIAPSNPQIVYFETVFDKLKPNQTGTLMRSSDSGKTFTQLSTPPTSLTNAPQFGVSVSPLDANHIFVTASDYETPCPVGATRESRVIGFASNTHGSKLSGQSMCAQGFFSVNGGQTWSTQNLPFTGVLGFTAIGQVDIGIVHAQGSRLYSLAGTSSNGGYLMNLSGTRLLTSLDDGASWQAADNGLPGTVCDFAAAPTGSTLYALMYPGVGVVNANCVATNVQPLSLWRSDNAGATWTKVHTFPIAPPATEVNDGGMLVAANGTLYMNLQLWNSDPTVTGFLASTDGGRSFTGIPEKGLPTSTSLTSIAGTLSDGSLLIADDESVSSDNNGPGALLAWRPGDAAWRTVSRQFPTLVTSTVVIPHQGKDTIYLTQESGVISHFTIDS